MAEEERRFERDYVDPRDPGECQPGRLPRSVESAELAAIAKRRGWLKEHGGAARDAAGLTGLSLSGGGIRSASFGLGCLQALQAVYKDGRGGEKEKIISGIEKIDYLSTVSGGGYIGACLTAAMQDIGQNCKSAGKFPVVETDDYSDTDAVRHIRDFSNYLIPHGPMDVFTAFGIIGRGLIANWLIILPVLLAAVCLTLLLHPTIDSLGEPSWLIKPLIESLRWPASWHGYWLTAILAVLNLVFLAAWAGSTSLGFGSRRALTGGWVRASKFFFFVTVGTAFLETQPFLLMLLNAPGAPAVPEGSFGHFWSQIWQMIETSFWAKAAAFFGSLGTVFTFLSKYLRDAVAASDRATGWQAWVKKFAAMLGLWLAGLLVPVLLWLIYLWLADAGLGRGGPGALEFYSMLLALSLLLAAFIDPNRTSLYGLYRDRLGKAFLFDPDGDRRDKIDGDLAPFDPKLHEINTSLCPYPVINAALNIAGSRFANKRGRDADFFIFTPCYTGSDATGYARTQQIRKDPKTIAAPAPPFAPSKEPDKTVLDLGTAMTISAAAVSSNMGSLTIKPLAFTLAFFNLRLGYWLANPRPHKANPPNTQFWDWLKAKLFKLHSIVLFWEMFGLLDEDDPKVYLTDGGHIENLGIYSLLKRRCKLIIAVDAEADPGMSFGAFLKLERYARIDLGVTLDLPWQIIQDQALAIGKAFVASKENLAIPCRDGPHCAACEIRYGPDEKENGVLIYVKASLSGDEDDYLLDYKRRYPAFPHETTGDQFFSEEQLEVYRALGFHIMRGLLTKEASLAVKPRPGETEDDARKRLLGLISKVLSGAPAAAAPVRC